MPLILADGIWNKIVLNEKPNNKLIEEIGNKIEKKSEESKKKQ